MISQEEKLLGKGLVFPILLDNTGKPVLYTGPELIRHSVRTILAYSLNQRFFLREFGANTDNLLDEPNHELLSDILSVQLTSAINTYEKRITGLSVIVISDYNTKLDIRITYSIKQTQKHDSFIFPFYKDIIQ